MGLMFKSLTAGASLLALAAAAGVAQAQITSRDSLPAGGLSAPAPITAPTTTRLPPSVVSAPSSGIISRDAPAPTRPVLRATVAAVVNDEPITSFDVTQRVIWFIVTTGVQPSEQNIKQLQEEALESLIDERLQAQELRRKAVARKMEENALFVAEDEIDDYLDSIAGENRLSRTQFMDQMMSRGLTTHSVRDQLKVQLSWRDFIRRYYGPRIRVGDLQVKQTLERISADAAKPSYLTSEIFFDAARAGGIENAKASATQRMQQLQQGARFEAVARQFSSLPSAAKGGDAGWMSSGEFQPEVEAVLTTMAAGQIRAVPVKDGVYLVLLREKKAGGATANLVTLKQAAVPLPAGSDKKASDDAAAKLAQVKAKATSCANLDAAAQSAGLDTDDLGEADLSTLAPAFRDAVQNLKPGQISAPVRSAQGLHLLAVCARRAAGSDIPSKQDVQNKLMVEQITMLQRRSLRDLRQSATISQPQ
jgi:peptidyl-prolyl cis-trans isomerase SurA